MVFQIGKYLLPAILHRTNKRDLESFDKKFEIFFDSIKNYNLTDVEFQTVLRPLKTELRYDYWRRKVFQIFLVICMCAAVYNVSFLNWNASAIGRIVMIKLIPYWNWQNLAREKCLVNYWSSMEEMNGDVVVASPRRDSKLFPDDCVVCENYDGVDRIILPDFELLYERYLIRGLPLIVQDSHNAWIGNNFTDFLLSLDRMVDSVPCEIQSNLIFGKYSNIEEMLLLSKSVDQSEGWFLHFQNCKFEPVKASRLIAPRPAYLSTHLDPAHSSWVLMSQYYNFHKNDMKPLFVQAGLIVMLQLQGELEVNLRARVPCYDVCGEHTDVLYEGNSLVFVSDLWDVYYRPSSSARSINFVNEIDWNP